MYEQFAVRSAGIPELFCCTMYLRAKPCSRSRHGRKFRSMQTCGSAHFDVHSYSVALQLVKLYS